MKHLSEENKALPLEASRGNLLSDDSQEKEEQEEPDRPQNAGSIRFYERNLDEFRDHTNTAALLCEACQSKCFDALVPPLWISLQHK